MKRVRRIEFLAFFILLYIGVLLIIYPYLFRYMVNELVVKLCLSLGMFFLFVAALLFFYIKISIKIENAGSIALTSKELGIEQITEYNYDRLETLISDSLRVRVLTNSKRLDTVGAMVNSIIRRVNKNTRFDILIVGENLDNKKYIIEDMNNSPNREIRIKHLEGQWVNDFILLDQKTCNLIFSDYDNSLEFICIYYGYSEHSYKSKKLFEELWNEGKVVSS